jgi:hypothetical protein
MRSSDRTYRSFEDFERDELRRFEAPGVSVDDMLDSIFGEESDAASARGRASDWDDDEDD